MTETACYIYFKRKKEYRLKCEFNRRISSCTNEWLEALPTGSTNLIVHWDLKRDFDKYVIQPISSSISDFLTDFPLAETTQLQAASSTGEAYGGVRTLHSLLTDRVISKENVPLYD